MLPFAAKETESDALQLDKLARQAPPVEDHAAPASTAPVDKHAPEATVTAQWEPVESSDLSSFAVASAVLVCFAQELVTDKEWDLDTDKWAVEWVVVTTKVVITDERAADLDPDFINFASDFSDL